MRLLLKLGKKGQQISTDTYYFALIIMIFLLSAWIIPIVNEAFDTSYTAQNIKSEPKSSWLNILTGFFDFIKTLFALAVWDISGKLGLPTWLQVFFKLLDLTLIYLGVRLLRGV